MQLYNFINYMFTTLDQLHHHHQQQRSWRSSFRREIKIVAGICVAVFVVNSLVTNAQLYAEAVQQIFQDTGLNINIVANNNSLVYSTENNSLTDSIIDENYSEQKKAVDNLTTSLEAMNLPQGEDFSSKTIIDSNLKQ